MEQTLEQLSRNQQYKGYDLYHHLGEVMQTIYKEQPADPLGSLEEISTLLWKQRHVQINPPPPEVPSEELDRCHAILTLLDKLESEAASKVDTLYFEMKDKWAEHGVTFNEDDALLLQCSMIALAEKPEIQALRLWGVFGLPTGAYYVAESDELFETRAANAPTVGPYDVQVEVGIGVNRFVYYVTRSPFDPWTRLPDLRPSDISGSRQINWQLTGDLNAAVHSFIPFDVTEDIYLRALISRITSATMVAPSGYIQEYQPEEEEHNEPPEDENEEEDNSYHPPKPLRLVISPDYEPVEIDNVEWVHVRPFILQQGRETYLKVVKPPKPKRVKKVKEETPDDVEAETEGEEEEEKKEEEEAPEEEEAAEEDVPEEGVELFGGIDADEGFGEEEPCWNTRNVTSPIEGESTVLAENIRWPGAMNLTDGKKCCNLYWGNGTKFVPTGFQPPAPPKLAKEYKRKMVEMIDATLDVEKRMENRKKPPVEEEEEEEDQED